ncbi:nucleotide sugar dehydrogenase [Paracoccus alcaliphilus]|uniref:Nucleotide sugar dehydrogenase n=2 Tax=Paracoccus alcaliphilus TaxID=34002 RepID=A0A1H8ECK5_9RHOB|nr:nucleotide sugar dehydrogenase [Paracoccus alcaliphilus]SEN17215.1 nucleotide sugar dehydrogenase [Paracoccus alcaliphilus]
MKPSQARIAVIGLGYVGLPLAVEFGKHYDTVGFDISAQRVAELRAGTDRTGEVDDLGVSPRLSYSSDLDDIRSCNVYIVAVPTPIDDNHKPDLTPLISASRTVGQVISAGDVAIYESTVYPGATEDDCIPVIESVSGLRFNQDFFAGYSPERINPGDKARPITKIIKVTSGSTPEIADFVDGLYASIIPAGTFKASSIRVAEAAKVIENTQRDVNIALINELSMVFSRLGIDTSDVIEAASTKWNFMRLKPGLVGGHCIGVDPYYLLHRSEKAGHIPDIIRMSREINDGMPREVSRRLVRAMIDKDLPVRVGGHKASRIISFSDADISFQQQLGIYGQVKGFAPVAVRSNNSYSLTKNTHLAYVGRIDFHAKDCGRLIDIAGELKKKNHPPILIFTTDGENSPGLKKFTELSVSRGVVDQFDFIYNCEDKDKIYSEIKILIMPSKKESFGNAVLEAFSYGVPVLAASYAPGPAELIGSGNCGLLLDDMSGPSVMAALNRLTDQDYLQMSSRAFDHHKNFSIEAHLDFLEGVARDVIRDFDGENRLPVLPNLKLIEAMKKS